MIHKGNVAPPRRRLSVGCGVRAGSRTITAVTYHHSVWLRQWHSGTPPGKNDAFIQLVSPDQAGHDRSDKTTFCVQHKKKKKRFNCFKCLIYFFPVYINNTCCYLSEFVRVFFFFSNFGSLTFFVVQFAQPQHVSFGICHDLFCFFSPGKDKQQP